MHERLVTIAWFSSAVDANLARAQLEAAGIRAFVSNEIASSFSPLPQEVGLQVASADEIEALAVLGESIAATGVPGAQEPSGWRARAEPERCPVCETSMIRVDEPALLVRLLRLVLAIFLRLPESALDSPWRSCGICGYRWKLGNPGITRVPTIG